MNTKPFDLQAWLALSEREIQWHNKRIRAVIVRRHFQASIERVWRAWVEGWTTRVIEGEAKSGQTVVLELGQPQRTTSHILTCEPPQRLVATWTYGKPTHERPDEVEVRIKPHREGSLFELEHRSDNGTTWAPGVGAGWEAGIMMFDVRFSGGDIGSVPTGEAFPKLDALWVELVKREEAKL